MIFLDVALRATNIKTNTDRLYIIRVEKKLFEPKWKVHLQNGRFGTWVKTRLQCFDTLKETKVFVRHVLNKRFKAQSRIGVNYKIIKVRRNIFFREQIKGYSKNVD
jgi:hypothetical protein